MIFLLEGGFEGNKAQVTKQQESVSSKSCSSDVGGKDSAVSPVMGKNMTNKNVSFFSRHAIIKRKITQDCLIKLSAVT